jgi:ketosteroid isomerase-like protein
MSRENVEVVRSFLADFADPLGERSERLAISPDVVWDLSTFAGWMGNERYVGRDEFLGFLRDWVQPYEEWAYEVERVSDAGGDLVLAVLHQHGRMCGGEAEVEMHYAIVYTVRDGQVQQGSVYATPEEALKALGLRE